MPNLFSTLCFRFITSSESETQNGEGFPFDFLIKVWFVQLRTVGARGISWKYNITLVRRLPLLQRLPIPYDQCKYVSLEPEGEGQAVSKTAL